MLDTHANNNLFHQAIINVRLNIIKNTLMKTNEVLHCGLHLMKTNEVLHIGLRLTKTN
jgi:hypothetical protein